MICNSKTTGSMSIGYSKDELLKLIDDHELISFDIFDTLVMRNVYFNKDVFRIVSQKCSEMGIPGFYEARIEAENYFMGSHYPFVEEIYAYLEEKLKISPGISREIMEYEIDTEKKVILPRNTVSEIFEYCVKCKKKVYIVSDMYIHRRDLEKILSGLGIKGYEKMFVSCEYGVGKNRGLFNCYLKEVPAGSCLHVGDSIECDILPAAQCNIDTFRLKTAAEMWEKQGGRVPQDLSERTQIAHMIAKDYNDPFRETVFRRRSDE